MASKIIGYLISLIGLIGLAFTFETVQKALNVTLPAGVSNNYLLIASLVILVIGIIIVALGGRRSTRHGEVPIYEKGSVVGYRRT